VATIRLDKVRKVFGPDERVKLPGLGAPQRHKAEGPHVALDGVNLLVQDGETMAVLGPSGCGKTTLLRVVAGLLPHEGHVYFDNRLMDEVKPHERGIGMVFQHYALYPHLDGYDNLGFTFRARKRPPEEAEERIRVTSEIMGIGFEQLLPHRPGRLSSGEQQRLAVGRALVRKPNVFLFDEPLSNLDAKLRVRTRGEIKRLLDRLGHTAMYVTHDQVEAIALGDRLAIMKAGRVEQVGSHALLYERPINAFVAGFLGNPAMNLLRGRLNERGAWAVDDLEIPVPEIVRSRLRVGWKLILGIRPEHARLAAGEPATLRGRVVHIERDLPGRVQTLYVERPPSLQDLAVTVPAGERILRGEWVPVVLPVDRLVFFEGKSEMRMG
jgi:multiple sugar transport system ATP-binding protein